MSNCYNCKQPTDKNKGECSDCGKQRLKERRKRIRELNSQTEMDWTGKKTCTQCKEELPRTAFSINLNETDKLASYCKECRALQQNHRLAAQFKYKFKSDNVNGTVLRAMKKEQKNRCVLCDKRSKRLHLDHDHKTGKIRGYICAFCNRTLVPTLEQYPELRSIKPQWEQYFLPKK